MAAIVEQEGADVWFTRPAAALMPPGISCKKCGKQDFEKEMDILEMLLSYGNQVYLIDTDGFKDVGEMSKADFIERKKEASFIDQSNYLLTKMFSF